MSSGVILLQKSYLSFSSPLFLILRQEITTAAVALFFKILLLEPVFHFDCKNGKLNRLDYDTINNISFE